MKTKILPFALLIFSLGWNISQAQIFVNDDATGANDGSSWVNAFTDLQDALAAAADGDQIWVAEGTYLPGDDPTASFVIEKNIHLYGGFAGTENFLSERGEPADHPSVLSGDLNGDDVLDDFETNRADNAMTVVTANDAVQTLLDGFTISHGHAGLEEYDERGRGGGIHSKLDLGGSLVVRNCHFTQNFANRQGAGLFAQNLENGGEAPFTVDNCSFQSNLSTWNGSGIYFSQWGSNSTIQVKDCQFDDNVAEVNGGGMGYWSSNTTSVNSIFEVEGCTFSKNSTQANASALSIGLWGENSEVGLKNSTFTENESGWFGTVTIWAEMSAASGNVDISDCLFENNQAVYSAGLSWGSLPSVGGYFTYNLSDCDFIGNHATELGGAMDFYGEWPSEMTVEGCTFIGNSAGLEGGAILAVTNHPEFVGRISNCVFENNSSPAGAAIVANDFTEEPGMTQDADITFENCLMTGNTGGGTVELHNIGTITLLNCTIADNPAGGIVQSENSTLALQNTILANTEGVAEYIGASAFVLTNSLGGNLVLDDSMTELLGEFDKPETEPGFMPDSYEPSSISALINAGVNDGVTALFDLAGEDRIQEGTVDIGAYESPFVTSAREVIAGEVGLSPNPATDFLYLQLPETVTQPVEVSLFDASGKMMKSQVMATGQPIELKGLAPGMYWVKAVSGEQVYIGKFVKQ